MKWILFLIPMAVAVEFTLLSIAFELLSAPNDIAVLAGVGFLCALVASNYFLGKFISNKIKL